MAGKPALEALEEIRRSAPPLTGGTEIEKTLVVTFAGDAVSNFKRALEEAICAVGQRNEDQHFVDWCRELRGRL